MHINAFEKEINRPFEYKKIRQAVCGSLCSAVSTIPLSENVPLLAGIFVMIYAQGIDDVAEFQLELPMSPHVMI
jgi:hypothetical protein